MTIPRGRYEDLEAKLHLQEDIQAPVIQGQELGRVSVELDGALVADLGLQALVAVPEAGFFGRSWDSLMLWGEGLFGDD